MRSPTILLLALLAVGVIVLVVVLLVIGHAGDDRREPVPTESSGVEAPKSGVAEMVPSPPESSVSKSELRVPKGFSAKAGTNPEPYSQTGWAQEIVQNRTGIEMVFIPSGEFMMGGSEGETEYACPEERPVHRVKITKPFYMGKYEVTQGEWQKVPGGNPNRAKGSSRLVVSGVLWTECQDFCQRAGDGLALPTEAQWEYACRAGTRTAYSFGDDREELKAYGWDNQCGHDRTSEVGLKKPNGWGLYDMHGNVCEWCQDWYDQRYYGRSPLDDPRGPEKGKARVVRGGGWPDNPRGCRSASRDQCEPQVQRDWAGFRVVLEVQ